MWNALELDGWRGSRGELEMWRLVGGNSHRRVRVVKLAASKQLAVTPAICNGAVLDAATVMPRKDDAILDSRRIKRSPRARGWVAENL